MKKIFCFSAALLLAGIPFYNMVIRGVYSWHIRQPEVVEGAAEIFFFMLAAWIGAVFNKNKSFWMILLFLGIYLTKQGVIIPVLADYVYFEVLSYIGFSLNRRCADDGRTVIWNFISGCAGWGCMAVLFSAAGWGTINSLRIMTIILFTAALFICRNRRYKPAVLHVLAFFEKNANRKLSAAVFVCIAALFAVLCAKSNTALDYDSLWYGLRPEYVLVGEHSFYDYLGYASFVHYYPKLMELLYLPVSGLGDYSFIICMNIGCFMVASAVIYQILDHFLKGASAVLKLFILLLLCSIPAAANIAATAKPDILGFLFTLCAFYYGLLFLDGKTDGLMRAYISLLLCTGTKLTYIAWGGILFVFLTSAAAVKSLKNKEAGLEIFRSLKGHASEIIPAVIFTAGIHARTYILTGYPLYPSGISLWRRLGFSSRHYSLAASNALSGENINYLDRIYQFIFNPSGLPHVIMLWTSNVLLYMFLAFAVNYKKNLYSEHRKRFLQVLAMSLIAVSIYFGLTMREPDGNYFILPITVSILIIIILLFECMEKNKAAGILYPVFPLLAANLIVMFISHPSWAFGTKCFDSRIISSSFDSGERNKAVLAYNGLGQIEEYLQDAPDPGRVLSSVMGDASVVRRLSTGIETVDQVASSYFTGGNILDSYSNFITYLRSAQIDGLLLAADEQDAFKGYTQQLLQEEKLMPAVYDQAGTLYLINSDL